MLQQEYFFRRFFNEALHYVLVAEEVGAAYRVPGM
jgi:hypothetical protein